MKHTAIERLGQWLLLTGSLTVALVAAGASMYISVSFGAKMSSIIAIVFGLADFLKVFMPLSGAAQGGMKGWQKAIWWIAVTLAVVAATSHLMEMQAERLQHAMSANRGIASKRADEDQLRAALGRITETMSVADATELVARAEKSFASADRLVKDLKIECAIRKACREADAKLIAAKERLAGAVARDKLQGELADIKPVAIEKVEVFGMGQSLSVITGWDEQRTSSILILVISMLCLLLLEAAAAGMALDAGKRIARMAKTWDSKPAAKPVSTQAVTSKDEVLKVLQAAYQTAEEMPSNRQLAERFGIPKSTFADWMREWKTTSRLPAKPVKLRVVA